MKTQEAFVCIVDDDLCIREALSELLASIGLRSAAFASTAEYLAFPRPDLPACLILDVHLPDADGLGFQEQICDAAHPPIVFITAHGDIPSSVRAIRHGAVDYLTKPFREADLISAIDVATTRDRELRAERAARAALQQRLSALTPREREVLPLVVSGLLNKQAAAVLGISEITLQIHRSKVMHKMKAASLADLVRMAERLHIPISHCRHVPKVTDDDLPPLSHRPR